MSKVTRRSLADDEKVIVFHLIHSVLTLWQDKAVCLAVHGLRAQRGRGQTVAIVAARSVVMATLMAMAVAMAISF